MKLSKRFLGDIHNNEISFVRRAANKRRFLYYKGEKGVKCPQCGEILKDERKGEDSKSCTLIRCKKCGYLFNPVTKKGVIKMKILRKFIEEFSGDKFKPEDFAKEIEKSGEEIFEKATKMLNDYRDGFPDDLKKAVVTLAKGLYIAATEKSDDTDTDKDKGDNDDATIEKKLKEKLSKEEFGKVKDLFQKKGDDADTDKDKDDDGDSIEKQIKEALSDEEFEKIEHIFKTANYNNNEKEIVKMLKNFNDRIATIEDGTGIKKGLDGQDDDDDDDDNDSEDNWPSIKLQ